FQIRLVQRILATNVVLAHMGVEKDVTCSFCGKERDAIEHIFWRCEHVKRFWEQLQTVVNNACANGLFVNLNESIVLFGHDCSFKSDDTFDLIILLAKFFIYKCKVKKNIPQFHLFRNYLKTAFEAYKYIAIINMSYDKFTKEWQFYKTLMES
ncbi:hypothetical protein, partial [Thiolapillus sp.]